MVETVEVMVELKHNLGVHFNPEIIEIEYQPEYPVSTTESFSAAVGYESEEEEDDAIGSLIVQIKNHLGLQIPNIRSYLELPPTQSKEKGRAMTVRDESKVAATSEPEALICLVASVIKTFVSFTATWLLWKSLSPLSWLYQYKNGITAGQSKTILKKK